MFVVSAVCCQVEVSATSSSLVQRSPTDSGVSLCVIYEGWNFNSGNYLFTTDTKYEGWNFNSGNYLFTTETKYEGWNLNSGNYLFTTDTK